MVDDAQTHLLPATRPRLRHSRCFSAMPTPRPSPRDLRHHLDSVEKHYAELFEEAPSLSGPGNLVFTGADDDPETLATLARLGFADPRRDRRDGARLAPRPLSARRAASAAARS